MVVISTATGYTGVPHAGGVYMRNLYAAMEPYVDLTVVLPGTRTNREAAVRPGAARKTLPLGLEPASSMVGRIANRVSLHGDDLWRRWDPGLPYLPLLVGLARSADARRAIRDADVVDFQWSDSIRLVHLVRRLNPRARLVGTFHDVMSQSFSREPQESRREKWYWRGVARRSRRHERRMVRALDHVLVFSEKDVQLLGSPQHCSVVRPPLSDGPGVRHTSGGDGSHIVLTVSYLSRDENNKAACWVVEDVWPKVMEQFPGARLRLVGGGASETLRELAQRSPGVELVGFVDDLDKEYTSAAVCLIPVLQGAGVKFKTIEALLDGVPIVTTTVGAEGLGNSSRFAAVTDSAQGLASAVVRSLLDPALAQATADASQEWARTEFSRSRFVEVVLRAWGIAT